MGSPASGGGFSALLGLGNLTLVMRVFTEGVCAFLGRGLMDENIGPLGLVDVLVPKYVVTPTAVAQTIVP